MPVPKVLMNAQRHSDVKGLCGIVIALVLFSCCIRPAAAGQPRIFAWGDNSTGQTNVPPGLTNLVAIAAGYYHGLALRSNGTVIAWGDNTQGQTNNQSSLTNVIAIDAGAYHSLALRSNSTVYAWGLNNN